VNQRGPVTILLIALAATRAQAQSTELDTPPRWAIAPYVGVARHSLVGTHLGVIPDRDHVFVGIHLTAALWRTRRLTFAFAPEVVPLLVITNNPIYEIVDTFDGRHEFEVGRGPVTGFAVSPIGFEGQLGVGHAWRAYATSAVGAVWFTRDVPVAYSRRFNYTFEVGGGALWQFRPRTSLRVGYKFHHLSNAFTALQNPGIDGAVFLAGIERTLGGHSDK